MLTGCKRKLFNVFVAYFLTVKGDFTLIGHEAENAFHKRCFACTVFTEKTDDFTAGKLKAYLCKGSFAAVFFCN